MGPVVWLGGIEPWCFRVVAYPGESFGHFFGRFRRANLVTSKGLATVLGLPATVVSRWEIPSMGQPPREEHLQALSHLSGESVEQLRSMLPPERAKLHLGTRLCAACYAEASVHLAVWQHAARPWCARHGLYLLTACPQCRTGFPLPSRWEVGVCSECLLPYGAMGVHQLPCQPSVVEVDRVPAMLTPPPRRRRTRPRASPPK